ncbi:MAG: IS66 family insertion sequence element accessory protein TnpB [Lachnospiraceae bacterium]|nr:IS66 family insertion sequence element accessory protein TnpB [Lachnospiraceae bacterium]
MTANHAYQLKRWKLLIEEQAKSGMKIIEWCRRNGITKDAFYYWRRCLQEEAYDEAVKQLPTRIINETSMVPHTEYVELNPCPKKDISLSPNENKPVAVIRSGATSIEIMPGATEDIIKALMMVVRNV